MAGIRDRLPVKIGERHYIAEVAGIQMGPLGDISRVLDNQAEPSERSLENQGIWKRTQEDWTLGAGQRYFDLRTDIDPSQRERVRWSRGLDLITERRQVELLRRTAPVHSAASGTDFVAGRAGGYLYLFIDTQGWISAPNAPDTAWTALTMTGLSSAVPEDFAVEGGKVFVCYGDQSITGGVWSADIGATTFTQFSSIDTSVLVGGAGRLLGGHNDEVWEFAGDGTKLGDPDVNIYQHTYDGFDWRAGTVAPDGVYMAGDDGHRTEIFFFSPSDVTGALDQLKTAGSLPEGEIVNEMAYYGGLVLLGTTLGLRLASPSSTGGLTFGPVIEQLGSITAIAFQENFAWVSCNNILDADGTAVGSGLAKINLERFPTPLVPAWAQDIEIESAAAGTPIEFITRLNNRTFFAAAVGATTAVFGETTVPTTSYVTSGELRTGAITFGTPEKMALSSIEVDTDPLTDTSSVDVEVYERIGGSTLDLAASTQDDDHLFRTNEPTRLEEPEIGITLNRGTDSSITPTMRRWTMRALPLMREVYEIILPLKVVDTVHDDADVGHDVRMGTPQDEWRYLRKLLFSQAPVAVELMDDTFIARVAGVGRERGSVDDWSTGQGTKGLSGEVTVRLITVNDEEA